MTGPTDALGQGGIAVERGELTGNGVPRTILEVGRESIPIDLAVILDGSATRGAVLTGSMTGMSVPNP